MEYRQWVRENFLPLAERWGHRFVPREELEHRLATLRGLMAAEGTEGVLLVQKMDRYYFSGTTQEGFVFVPVDGPCLVMVKREPGRAALEAAAGEVVAIDSVRSLPAIIRTHRGRLPECLGMELDVVPVRDYFRYCGLFEGSRIVDAAGIIARTRTIKTPFEVDLIRKAGEIGRAVYLEGASVLRAGMTEIEFGGILEAAAKTHGDEGLIRVRSLTYEAYSWHVLSGPAGGIVSQSNSPMGGLGLSPAFPVGASRRVMEAREPILVDFGTCYHGYQADETRMFSIGRMPSKFEDAYKVCEEIHDAVLAEIRPGADCEALFHLSVEVARKRGYGDSFLGPPGFQTTFIGHGIGLELSEVPFLARGQSYPLEEGMTCAVEPKIVFPGEGAVGFENTVVVTSDGCEILTPLTRGILEV